MKLDRLISVLVVLLRKERVAAKELAGMFGVSTRTILRDIDAINLTGIRLSPTRKPAGIIYSLERSYLFWPFGYWRS